MNGCCSSKDTKVIRFLIFQKIGFLNFAILKSSPKSKNGPPDQKVLSVKLGAFLKTKPLIQI